MMVWLKSQGAGDYSLDCSSHLFFCPDLITPSKRSREAMAASAPQTMAVTRKFI